MRQAALIAALLVALWACGDGGCDWPPEVEKPTHVRQQ